MPNQRFPFLTKQDEINIENMMNSNPEIFDHLSDQQSVAIYLNSTYQNN